MESEIGVMQPQAKEMTTNSPLEPQKTVLCRHLDLGLWPLKLREKSFLFF